MNALLDAEADRLSSEPKCNTPADFDNRHG
jgi:hypothetical protein